MSRRIEGSAAGCRLLAALVLFGSIASAQVIRVPNDQSTIRAALAAATNGTTIQVAAGIYDENLIWPATDGIRLVSESGATLTTITGGGRGRVIKFGSGLTRATELVGFTIRGGVDPDGAGIWVGSSPTIRDNHITGNTGTSASLNRGGGIHVAAAAAPRIQGNAIQGNLLDKAQLNQGAGIYVADGAHPWIVGNSVFGNIARGPGRSTGGGIHFGLTGTPSPLLAGNEIGSNTADGSTGAAGGGVYSSGGTLHVTGNTIHANTCKSLVRATGGGIHFDKTGAAGSRLHNNIAALNVVSAPSRSGGGIQCDGTAPSIDFNNVWNNTGGDYFGCAPGLNDTARDPKFAAAGDFHLAAGSPCVDAGSNALAPAGAAIDADGDSRMLDGNLDGLVGNGARVDIGADEAAIVRLTVPEPLDVGGTVRAQVQGPATAGYVLVLSLSRTAFLVQPYGMVLINPPFAPLASGGTPAGPLLRVPFVNALAGLDVHLQAFVNWNAGGTPVGQLTNAVTRTLMLRFGRPIVESFTNTAQVDPAGTTAAWTLAGKPGLHATYGFGGGGADGPLAVVGNATLDSSTRAPGADGVVEWNFTSLHVASGSRLTLTGPRPIRLNVYGNSVVAGVIDAAGKNGRNAPAGTAVTVGKIPGGAGGPGGGVGGTANDRFADVLGSLPMDLRGGPGYPGVIFQCGEFNRSSNRLITVIEPNCGGGTGGNRGTIQASVFRDGCSGNGGGHAVAGQRTDFQCQNLQAFGKEFGSAWVQFTGAHAVNTLTAGSGGGGGGNAQILSSTNATQDIVAGSGGGGGGGLEVVTLGSLTVAGSGSILAHGGSGGIGHTTVASNTTVRGGWGAGGGGGSIWLSGTSVTVQSGAVLDALGGIGNPNPPIPGSGGNGGAGYVIIRDLSGTPTIQSNTISPAPAVGRGLFAPSAAGNSTAMSRWYGAAGAIFSWAFDANNPSTGEVTTGQDLSFLNPPAAGQKVFIDFQGAPDLSGGPDPNPSAWYPPGNTTQNPNTVFETDITKLRGGGYRWVRFRVRFQLGSVTAPLPNQVVIDKVKIRY